MKKILIAILMVGVINCSLDNIKNIPQDMLDQILAYTGRTKELETSGNKAMQGAIGRFKSRENALTANKWERNKDKISAYNIPNSYNVYISNDRTKYIELTPDKEIVVRDGDPLSRILFELKLNDLVGDANYKASIFKTNINDIICARVQKANDNNREILYFIDFDNNKPIKSLNIDMPNISNNFLFPENINLKEVLLSESERFIVLKYYDGYSYNVFAFDIISGNQTLETDISGDLNIKGESLIISPIFSKESSVFDLNNGNNLESVPEAQCPLSQKSGTYFSNFNGLTGYISNEGIVIIDKNKNCILLEDSKELYWNGDIINNKYYIHINESSKQGYAKITIWDITTGKIVKSVKTPYLYIGDHWQMDMSDDMSFLAIFRIRNIYNPGNHIIDYLLVDINNGNIIKEDSIIGKPNENSILDVIMNKENRAIFVRSDMGKYLVNIPKK